MQANQQQVVGLHLEWTEDSAPHGGLVDRTDEVLAPTSGVRAVEQVVVVRQPVSDWSRQRRAAADLLTVYVKPDRVAVIRADSKVPVVFPYAGAGVRGPRVRERLVLRHVEHQALVRARVQAVRSGLAVLPALGDQVHERRLL